MLHFFAQVVLGSLLHLGQNHRRHLLGSHDLILALDLHADHRLAGLVYDLIGQKLDVLLHRGVLEAPADQTLHVKQCLGRIDGGLVLGSLSNKPFVVGKCDVRRRDSVALIIRDDLYSAILVNSNAGIGGAQIDTDHRAIDLLLLLLCNANAGGHQKG
mmetsp:Transcript_33187/g.71537  ORF Transcript_33187/g.71537 Transcript_33187/m.71537 type:complete len:158 (+) Transcript_33187:1677-2150(+)